MKEFLYENRKRIMIGGVALAVVLAVVLVLVVRSHSRNVRYENYMETAETYLLTEDYDRAISYFERAFDIKKSDECAISLARAYAAAGQTDKAEEILLEQIQDSKGKQKEELKAVLEELRGQADDNSNGIFIGGEAYHADTTSVIIQNTRLTAEDLETIAGLGNLVTLSLKNCELTDITFLEDLSALMSLTLTGNEIKDLTPLKELRGLKTLYLDENPIEDFSPLYGLSSLTTLSLKGIEITQSQYDDLKEKLSRCSIFSDDAVAEELTLGGVTFLSDVTELNLSGKNIQDISELAKCLQLRTLNLKDNDIKDLSALEGLENLTWLCLYDNDISDVASVGQLTNLTYLDLGENEITNINSLSSLSGLTELYLDDNEISSYSALSSMKSLRKLGLKDTGLTDKALDQLKISTLTALDISENDKLTGSAIKALKEAIPKCDVIHDEHSVKLGNKEFDIGTSTIDASNASVTDLSNLSQLTSATALMLNNNPISDFTPISGMKNLTVLELWNTGVSDTTFLAGMSKLTNLNLAQNNLRDVYTLSSCTGLTELILTGNTDLTDIAPLTYCTKLKILYLDHTGVTDVSDLSSLTGLTTLYLDDCQLEDATQLHSLTSLKELYVMNCGLSKNDVAALRTALPGCSVYAGE